MVHSFLSSLTSYGSDSFELVWRFLFGYGDASGVTGGPRRGLGAPRLNGDGRFHGGVPGGGGGGGPDRCGGRVQGPGGPVWSGGARSPGPAGGMGRPAVAALAAFRPAAERAANHLWISASKL